jgi:hypothetical protein
MFKCTRASDDSGVKYWEVGNVGKRIEAVDSKLFTEHSELLAANSTKHFLLFYSHKKWKVDIATWVLQLKFK